jgi:hypothetical protein
MEGPSREPERLPRRHDAGHSPVVGFGGYGGHGLAVVQQRDHRPAGRDPGQRSVIAPCAASQAHPALVDRQRRDKDDVGFRDRCYAKWRTRWLICLIPGIWPYAVVLCPIKVEIVEHDGHQHANSSGAEVLH